MLGHYLLFPAIASLAGAAMAGIGLLISVSSRSAVQAQGRPCSRGSGSSCSTTCCSWERCGQRNAGGMAGRALVANPVDAARVLGVLALEPDLYLLGPAGAFIAARFSPAGAAALLLAALGAWTVAPVVGAHAVPAAPPPRGAAPALAHKHFSSRGGYVLMIRIRVPFVVALTVEDATIACSSDRTIACSVAAAQAAAPPAKASPRRCSRRAARSTRPTASPATAKAARATPGRRAQAAASRPYRCRLHEHAD